MAKRKKIKVYKGKAQELAIICKCSKRLVSYALSWHKDTETENLVRKRAKELGFIKQF